MARNTPAVETTETDENQVDVTKNYQVNATIPGVLYKALDDHRWDARIDRMPKLVAKALKEYGVNHGLINADGSPVEAVSE